MISALSRLTVFLAGGTALAQSYTVSRMAGGVPPEAGIQAVKASLGPVRAVAINGAGVTYISAATCIFRLEPGGILTRIAGTGTPGYAGDDTPAVQARIGSANAIAFDSKGTLHFADWGEVRSLTPAGTLRTVLPLVSDSELLAIAFDGAGNLYAAYPQDRVVRKITPGGILTVFAGNGIRGQSGDGGPATAASLDRPLSLAVDRAGNVYIADSFMVRRVSPSGVITRVAARRERHRGGCRGDGRLRQSVVDRPGPFRKPTDRRCTRVRRVTASGQIQTVVTGGAPEARSPFGVILGLAVDSEGNILVAQGARLDRIDTAGRVSTLAGNGSTAYSGDDGPAIRAQVAPIGIVRDWHGNTYFTDYSNHVVRKIAADGIISTIAGTGVAGFSGDVGPATQAQLNGPMGIATDAAGNVYFVDTRNSRIRKITTDGRISTVWSDVEALTRMGSTSAEGLAVGPDGSLYFAHTMAEVWRVTPAGVVSIVAGNATLGYSGDGGPATGAALFGPWWLAVDRVGNLYIADVNNARIRRVTADGTISTVAGGGTKPFAHGVAASEVELWGVRGIGVDASGVLYIAETGAIRKVTPDGLIRFVALSAIYTGAVDTPPRAVQRFVTPDVLAPSGLWIEPGGAIWAADLDSILRIAEDPDQSTRPRRKGRR